MRVWSQRRTESETGKPLTSGDLGNLSCLCNHILRVRTTLGLHSSRMLQLQPEVGWVPPPPHTHRKAGCSLRWGGSSVQEGRSVAISGEVHLLALLAQCFPEIRSPRRLPTSPVLLPYLVMQDRCTLVGWTWALLLSAHH